MGGVLEYLKDFFDGFFMGTATIVFLLIAIDWLIGPEGREAMREKMADWWRRLEKISFTGLAAEDARKVLGWLHKVIGPTWRHPRTIIMSVLFSIVITIVLTATFLALSMQSLFTWYFSWNLFLIFAIPNAVFDWLSVAATMGLLGWMAKSLSGWRLFSIVLFDVFLAFIFAILVLMSASAIMNIMVGPSFSSNTVFLGAVGFLVGALLGESDAVRFFLLAILFTSALPTLLHSGLSFVFLSSKLFRPVIQPIASRLLYLFSVSNRGVLTQLSIGIGFTAKLIQQWVKFLTATPPPV